MRLLASLGGIVFLVSACGGASPGTLVPATAPVVTELPATSPPATAPPATVPAQPSETVTEAPSAPASALDWARYDGDQVFDHGTVNDVTFGNGMWLAVGNITSSDSIDAAIWTSGDGETWTLLETGESLSGMTINAITPMGDGFAAVGTRCGALEGCAGGGEVYLSSPDGASWTRYPKPDDECCIMQAITAKDSGLVAVGFDYTTGFPATPADAGVRHSTDGEDWTKIVNPGAFTASTMGDVAAGGPGFVAVGQSSTGPQVWISADGTEWATASTSSAMGPGQALKVAARDDLVVAVGSGAHADASVWTSDASGDSWSTATSPGAGAFRAVMVTPSSIVVGGKDGSNAVVWTSGDATTWVQTMTDPEISDQAAVENLAVDDNGTIVAFGTGHFAVVRWVGHLGSGAP